MIDFQLFFFVLVEPWFKILFDQKVWLKFDYWTGHCLKTLLEYRECFITEVYSWTAVETLVRFGVRNLNQRSKPNIRLYLLIPKGFPFETTTNRSRMALSISIRRKLSNRLQVTPRYPTDLDISCEHFRDKISSLPSWFRPIQNFSDFIRRGSLGRIRTLVNE